MVIYRLTLARDQDFSPVLLCEHLDLAPELLKLLPSRPNVTGRGTPHVCCKSPFAVSDSNPFGGVLHI